MTVTLMRSFLAATKGSKSPEVWAGQDEILLALALWQDDETIVSEICFSDEPILIVVDAIDACLTTSKEDGPKARAWLALLDHESIKALDHVVAENFGLCEEAYLSASNAIFAAACTSQDRAEAANAAAEESNRRTHVIRRRR